MATNVLLCLGLLIIVVGTVLFISKKRLYKNGIRTVGKVIKIETYNSLTPGPEFNTLYYTGITPIIEVEENGEKIRVAYYAIDDYSNIAEGDEVEVIYPKGRIEELVICNEKELYKGPLLIGSIGLLSMLLALTLALI